MEGPSVCLTFLGIELDTRMMVIRLPSAKLTELYLVRYWFPKLACKLKELQSLVGKLQYACKVVRPGRIFLCRMLEPLRVVETSTLGEVECNL